MPECRTTAANSTVTFKLFSPKSNDRIQDPPPPTPPQPPTSLYIKDRIRRRFVSTFNRTGTQALLQENKHNKNRLCNIRPEEGFIQAFTAIRC